MIHFVKWQKTFGHIISNTMFTLETISSMNVMHQHPSSTSFFQTVQPKLSHQWHIHVLCEVKFTFVHSLRTGTCKHLIHWGWHLRGCFPIWKILMKPSVRFYLLYHVKTHPVLPSASAASIIFSNSSSMVTTIVTIPSDDGISEGVSWTASSVKILMKLNLFKISFYLKAHLCH